MADKIQPYYVQGKGDNRILIVPQNKSHRFHFRQITNGRITDVKFRRFGSVIIAPVSDKVLVYTKPRLAEFHREAMIHNSRQMWLGLPKDFDNLMENMCDFYEII